MGTQPPFLYQSERYGDVYDGFPSAPFDPKAVTRASFQSQRPRPKPDGPLVQFGRHPDAQAVPTQRSFNWKPMSDTTVWWIKASRICQLVLRVLELIAAAGVLVLFILMTNTTDLVAWVMRITAAVVIFHCVYGIYHLSRTARARTPGSSGAYHTFAGITDLVVLPLYAYGALSARNNGAEWTTRLSNELLTSQYLVPATYYTLIGSGGAHLLSLTISLWLALMFRRIHKMPPDMNPLESHLTARATHKRNKSSVVTTSTSNSAYADSIDKRFSNPMEEARRSGQPYEDMTHRPPTVPFMHTRQGSSTSLQSSLKTRDSRTDLPARNYQVPLANRSPRHSGASDLSYTSKRLSGGPSSPTKLVSTRNSYAQLPLTDNDHNPSTLHQSSRPTTSNTRPTTNSSYRTSYTSQASTSIPTPPRHSTTPRTSTAPTTPTTTAHPPREPRFTEAWYASESLVSRTQAHLNRTTGGPASNKSYAPLEQAYDDDDISSDSENEENCRSLTRPHPLRSNPTTPHGSAPGSPAAGSSSSSPRPASQQSRPFSVYGQQQRPPSIPNFHRNSPLSELALNDRRVSGGGSGRDIADQMLSVPSPGKQVDRKSSIQPEAEFFVATKPYAGLRDGTPPVMGTASGNGRQVSSGNDYAEGRFGGRFSVFGRRNVSGKVAEEGRGGGY